MTQTQPRPFAFDVSFDDGAPAPAPVKRSYSLSEVEALRQQAYLEGEAAAAASLEGQQSVAMMELSEAARAGLSALAQVAHTHRVHAAGLAMACGRAIGDMALAMFPQAPLQSAMESLSREFDGSPRLTLRTQADPETLTPIVEQMARDIGFAGQVVVRQDSSGSDAAFTLDWGDGSAVFNPDATAARIADAVAASLAAERLHGDAIDIPPDGDA